MLHEQRFNQGGDCQTSGGVDQKPARTKQNRICGVPQTFEDHVGRRPQQPQMFLNFCLGRR